LLSVGDLSRGTPTNNGESEHTRDDTATRLHRNPPLAHWGEGKRQAALRAGIGWNTHQWIVVITRINTSNSQHRLIGFALKPVPDTPGFTVRVRRRIVLPSDPFEVDIEQRLVGRDRRPNPEVEDLDSRFS
jgi:hypothetical protein